MTQADGNGSMGKIPASGRQLPDAPSPMPEEMAGPAVQPSVPQSGGSGIAGLIGVVFVIGLLVLAAVLINRLKTSSDLMDCAITHAPACRELIRD